MFEKHFLVLFRLGFIISFEIWLRDLEKQSHKWDRSQLLCLLTVYTFERFSLHRVQKKHGD